MKAIILDGSPAGDSSGARIRQAVLDELAARGWAAEPVTLHAAKIGACAGDFLCWTRNPGICNTADDNRTIAAAIARSDLMILLTPVTFGGYSSVLKRMVDHFIQNISPYFATVQGETHHQKRYDCYPNLLALGWQTTPDAQTAAIFRGLVYRNSLNFYAATTVSEVLPADLNEDALHRGVQARLDDIAAGRSSVPCPLPDCAPASTAASQPIHNALLLLGSPRLHKSTSHSLGRYLMDQLGGHGVRVETAAIHTALNSTERWNRLIEAVTAADLVALACPLYVDSLPAPVTTALERLAAHRAIWQPAHPQQLVALINCGFPEAHHNDPAVAICAAFARQAHVNWGGAITLGAGGMIEGQPLVELGGRTQQLRRALDQAAAALAQGQPIPPAAAAQVRRPVIPHWLYRLIGHFGWRQLARRYNTQKLLRRRPYLENI